VSDDSNPANREPIAPAPRRDLDALVQDSVTTALNLGWWMADAFHFAKPGRLMHPDQVPKVPDSLANLSQVQPRDRFRMYIDGVEVHLKGLARVIPDAQNAPSAEPMRAALKALDTDDKEAANNLLMALNRLNMDVLTWLLAIDRRLGTAYGLGRSLFITTRNQEAHLDKLRAQFDERIIEIRKWLDQLASALPPYSAGIVRHSLDLWTDEVRATVHEPDSDSVLTQIARHLPEQGDVWRSLLSGDLDGRVLLDSSDYADIAEQLAVDNRRLLGLLSRRILFTRPARVAAARAGAGNNPNRRHGLPLIVYFTLAISVVLIVSVFAATGSPTVRVAAALVALVGGGISVWRIVSQPLNAAMRTVNRPLYDAQLTVHVALRISWPLDSARRRHDSHAKGSG
jgi:hypothetical protein